MQEFLTCVAVYGEAHCYLFSSKTLNSLHVTDNKTHNRENSGPETFCKCIVFFLVSCLSFVPRESFSSPYLHNVEALGVSLSHHLSDNTQYWQAWFSCFSVFCLSVCLFNSKCLFLQELLGFLQYTLSCLSFWFLLLPCALFLFSPAGHSECSATLYFPLPNSQSPLLPILLMIALVSLYPFPTLLSACSIYFIKHCILCLSAMKGSLWCRGRIAQSTDHLHTAWHVPDVQDFPVTYQAGHHTNCFTVRYVCSPQYANLCIWGWFHLKLLTSWYASQNFSVGFIDPHFPWWKTYRIAGNFSFTGSTYSKCLCFLATCQSVLQYEGDATFRQTITGKRQARSSVHVFQ